MASESPQRIYRAPCPGCGAPVEFRSAQSTHAVCSFCQSTVVREGEVLSRIGKMAELFDDHSPLQLMASGRWDQRRFTLVGRLQYRSTTGTWTEWSAVFDDGSTAILGEDNGSYVFSLPAAAREVPQATMWRVGSTTAIEGKSYTVASSDQVSLVSAQGELPKLPPLGQPFASVELRSEDGEVFSIDYGSQPPSLSRGRAVLLENLELSGLQDESAKELKGSRQFACPNCGAQVNVALDTSKSVTCRACNTLIDLSSGIGGELRHAAQDEPVQPLIALGTMGQLQGVQWQVVGFQHRMGTEPDDPDEQFGWSEYLLYNRQKGFTFLVDSEEGWSVVKPTTGAPKLSGGGKSASYLGTTYALKYSYNAETSYVAGEFYWPVVRGQKTFNRDFEHARSMLSQEKTPTEDTWSSGSKIESDVVAAAFKLEGKKDLLKRDAAPGSVATGIGCGTIFILFFIVLILLVALKACRDESGGSSRSSGGSFGGFSSGGGHK